MPKTDTQLALDEKIDLARTMIRFKARRSALRELNEIEDRIKKVHDAEVASGSVSQIDLESIGVSSLAKELPSGEKSDSDSTDDADDSSS